jgi:hypothetical protein
VIKLREEVEEGVKEEGFWWVVLDLEEGTTC